MARRTPIRTPDEPPNMPAIYTLDGAVYTGDGKLIRHLLSAPTPTPYTDIRAFRKSLGLTQTLFAQKVGVRQATVSDWELGLAAPSPLAQSRLNALSQAAAPNA